MKKFKLVLADNDGTLVNDKREMTARTKEVLEKLHEQGYLFGLASGRGYYDLKTYPEKWGLSFIPEVFVCYNGAELKDNINDRIFQYSFLQPEQIRQVIELCNTLGLNPHVFHDQLALVREVDDLTQKSMDRNVKQVVRVVEDDSEFYSRQTAKVLYRLSLEGMAAFEKFLEDKSIPGVIGYKTQPHVYEFVSENTRKSFAIRQFCEMHDISLDEVIAFGDTSNDNDMLACCYGVCMANGSPDTKAVSKEITRYTNNEDGFADYVEQHLLQEDDQ